MWDFRLGFGVGVVDSSILVAHLVVGLGLQIGGWGF